MLGKWLRAVDFLPMSGLQTRFWGAFPGREGAREIAAIRRGARYLEGTTVRCIRATDRTC